MAQAKKNEKYIHGYTPEEQARLYDQAKILAEHVFSGVELGKAGSILEIGSGVGAQTEYLLKCFPRSRVTSVDRSAEQLSQARAHFENHPKKNRVSFVQADATALPFKKAAFDGAFLCWILEHVPDPAAVLKEARRCLRPGSRIFLNEVFNQLFFVHPRSEAVDRYWGAFNELQLELGGDPFVGAKLGHYLRLAGFRDIRTQVGQILCDSRDPRYRRKMLESWKNLLLSGSPGLLEKSKVDRGLVKQVKREAERLAKTPDSVLFMAWIKASAKA